MHSHDFGVAPWQHIPGHLLHNYLEKFAEHFGVTRRIRFNTKVELVEESDDGQWILTLRQKNAADSTKVIAKRLIVATGMTSNPNFPAISGATEFKAPLFHAKDFLQQKDILQTAKRVVVYGGAKSAWDAVYAYASSGVSVDWVIRESGRGPCWMVPPFVTPLKIWIEKLVVTRLLTWLSPCVWGARDGYEAIKNLIHTSLPGKWIVSNFFGFLGQDTLMSNNYDGHSETKKLTPWSDAFWSGTSLSIVNYPTDFFEYLRTGRVKVIHADITHLTERTVHLSTGESLSTDALHCATGWKHESPIKVSPESLLPELGLPHIASTVPSSLAVRADEEIFTRFPMLRDQPNITPKNKIQNRNGGQEHDISPYRLFRFMVPPKYIYKRNFAVAGVMLSFGQPVSAQIQALWITSYMTGTLSVPSNIDEIQYNTELFSRYSRWRTPAGCGSKHGDMVFEVLPYWDLLLQDLELPYKRKPTWFQEIFLPYDLSDYKGIVQEWIQLKKSGKLTGPAGATPPNQIIEKTRF